MTDPLDLPAYVAREVTHAGRALVERTRSQVMLAQRVVAALPCFGRHAGPADEPVAAGEAPSAPAALTAVPSEDVTVPVAPDGNGSEPALHEAVPEVQNAPDADELAIPDYDSLAASQVVPRLAALTTDELADVGTYERAHRARQTILNRVRQLQSAAGT